MYVSSLLDNQKKEQITESLPGQNRFCQVDILAEGVAGIISATNRIGSCHYSTAGLKKL